MLGGVWYLGQAEGDRVRLHETGKGPVVFPRYEEALHMSGVLNRGYHEGEPATGGPWMPYTGKQLEGMQVVNPPAWNPPARPRAAAETPELGPQ